MSGVDGKLYLWAGDVVNPTESITETVDWQADGQWHEYLIDISDQSLLTGYFNGIRFDYFDGAAASGDNVQLRSIRFLKEVSTPTVSVSASAVEPGEDLTITFSGLDSYIDGADYMHPYMAVYAEGSYPGNGESVLWNYVYTSGTMSILSSFQGAYAGQDLPVGNYTVWLTYDTAGRATYISGVHLASADKCASFAVVSPSAEAERGDVDGNGTINMLDVIALRRYLINSTEYPVADDTCADSDGNGTVNMLDVIALRRYLINSTQYPLA